MARGSRIEYKLEQAIEAIFANKTLEEAAQSISVSLSTLKRWKKRPDFQAAFLEARHDSLDTANARIQQNAGGLAALALKLAADPKTPPSVRVRVTLGLLEHANKTLLLEALAMRIAALESAMKKPK